MVSHPYQNHATMQLLAQLKERLGLTVRLIMNRLEDRTYNQVWYTLESCGS